MFHFLSMKAKKEDKKPVKKKEDLSEDEAALIIQSQFRGFQARKQYGPIVGGGKMDAATRIFIKTFAKKWKTSSIFHVLLLYRAAKYQELVYFSQQAHLYNQNAVSAMTNSNNDSVPLKNIDQRVKASQFLGEFKPAVWKLPFRINEFPFCDTHLDPTNKIPLGDDVSWDDPFKYQAPSDYYQYYIKRNEKKPIYVREEDSNEVINYIQTPYCRDPNVAESMYQGQPYRKYETIKRGPRKSMKGRAPTPQKEPVNTGVNVRQQINNFRDVNPVKSFAPNPPPANFSYSQNSNFNNNGGNNFGIRPKVTGPKRDHNPIIELESRGLRNTTDDEDEPPFNFQAMLRKTNVNRASLRRSPTPEDRYNRNDTTDFGKRSDNKVPGNNYGGYNRNNNNYSDNVVYSSSNASKQNFSYEPSNSGMYSRNAGSSMQNTSGYRSMSQDITCKQTQTVSTELLPGLVMHGKVAEL